jgi:hypothetical protein
MDIGAIILERLSEEPVTVALSDLQTKGSYTGTYRVTFVKNTADLDTVVQKQQFSPNTIVWFPKNGKVRRLKQQTTYAAIYEDLPY